MLRVIILGLAFCGFSSQLIANDFEIALSSETAQFTFRSDSSLIGWGGADLAFSLFYNEADDILGQVGLMQFRPPSEETPLTFGVGVRAYAGSLDIPNSTVLALAISGEVRYTIPGTMPMAFYFIGNYAPDITSYSDTKSVLDYGVGFQIEVLPQTTAFVGFRVLEVDTKTVKGYELD
ncbi:MAG: hypothetical protein O6938_10645, partial [Gammaproteobacteria bacterium]|nr:hypothetical protein [Gammaproteobacteria bacterium]